MRARLLFLPLAGVIAAAAVLGLSMGRKTMTTTETPVIEAFAARYVSEAGPGAKRTDCTARPAASDGLWLVVSCAAQGAVAVEYFIDRFGKLAHRDGPEPFGDDL